MLSIRTAFLEGLEVAFRFLGSQSFEGLWIDGPSAASLGFLAVGNTVAIGIRLIGIGLFWVHSPVPIQIFRPVRQAIVVTVGIARIGRVLGTLLLRVGQAILIAILGALRLRLLAFLLSLWLVFAFGLTTLLLLIRLLTLVLRLVLLLLVLLFLLSLLGLFMSPTNLVTDELEIELGVFVVRVDLERSLIELDGLLQPTLSISRISKVVERLSSDARILSHRRLRKSPVGLREVPHLVLGAADVESDLRVLGAFHLQVDEALESLVEEPRIVGLVRAVRTATLPFL